MFVKIESDYKNEGGPVKTSDPDKFVQLAIKSSDALLGKKKLIFNFFTV